MVAKVELYVKPTYLYRYRSLRPEPLKRGKVRERLEEELDAIEKHFVYCSTYNSMNDPMEGLYRSPAGARSNRSWSETQDIQLEKLSLGIASFTEAWDHELMWAHYADGFQGICVAYHLGRLAKRLPDECALTRVAYGDRPPLWSGAKARETRARILLSQKSLKWAYEREWRLFAPSTGKIMHGERAVDHVYLGTRISDPNDDEITARLTALGIDVRRTRLNGYSVKRKPPHL